MTTYTRLDLIRLILESDDIEVLKSGMAFLEFLYAKESEAEIENLSDRGSAADQEADYSENEISYNIKREEQKTKPQTASQNSR